MKYFMSRMRVVLSARSRNRPRRPKCHASPCDIVASITPSNVCPASFTCVKKSCGASISVEVAERGAAHHQVEAVHLHPHLGRDHLAHRPRVLAGAVRAAEDRARVVGVERQEADHVLAAELAEVLVEGLAVAGGVHERLPLLLGLDREVEHEVEVHVDEAGDVLRALHVARHPVDRVGDAAQHRRSPHRASTQVSLLPAALGRVHDERSLLQRDAGEPAGQHRDVLAVQHERPQVDVASLDARLRTITGARERPIVGCAM